MKKTTKLMCLLLVMLMIVGTLAACGGDATDTGANTGDSQIKDPSDTEGYESVYTPSGNKYDGQDFIVLLSSKDSGVKNFFEFSEEEPTVIDNAVQRRNASVEADYDVKIQAPIIDTGASNKGAEKMQQAISSESLEYHLSFIESYSVVPLATQGALYELNSLEGVNLKNEWWDQNANRDLTVNDLMFFTTGDIDAWDDMQQFIMMFNRTTFTRDITSYTVDNFYKLVQDGKWTFDIFFEIAKGYTKDLNGDDTLDKNDQWGMITWNDTIYSVFASCGGQVVSYENGELALPIFGNQTAQNCMREYTEWTAQNAYNYSVRDNNSGGNAIKIFSNDQALFFLGRLSSLNNFRDMDSQFGVVPVPKYTEDQTYNVTCSPYHLNLMCTLNLDTDVTMRGEVIESLAYYSRQFLTPAYREKTLEGQQVRDDGSLETLKITADNRIYDIGFFLRPGNITPELIGLYKKNSTDYASMYASVRTAAEMAVNDVATAYDALASEWSK